MTLSRFSGLLPMPSTQTRCFPLLLTAHEAADVELDEGCQEVCYENGVYLLLRKMQGVWYITDVFAAEETVGYEPIFFWQKIRRGADFILAHVLSDWRQLTERMVLNG